MKKSIGIYIHIPFCLQKCRYCDFCSFAVQNEETKREYAKAIRRDIVRVAETCGEYTVNTVYFGGGTPSLLPIEEIQKIMDTLNESFEISRDVEITMDCNPATVTFEYLKKARTAGVNRLSIGLQSAVDSELKLLGRVHGLSDFISCYGEARDAGFDNISVDLMYGIPDQTFDSLKSSLRLIEEINPEHVSVYGLMIEEGTYFAEHINELNVADDDVQAEMYIFISDKLKEMGYEKYEISNFSRKGYRSRHNMRYWLCGEYLGFGVAAHSYFKGVRFGNSRDMIAFLSGEDITEEKQTVDEDQERVEYVMLGMRLAEGISRDEYKKRFGRELEGDVEELKAFVKQGFVTDDGDRVAFTDKGFLVSNELISRMIE